MRTNAMNKVLYSDMEYSNEDMVKFLYDYENIVLMLGVFDVIIRMWVSRRKLIEIVIWVLLRKQIRLIYSIVIFNLPKLGKYVNRFYIYNEMEYI